MRSNHRPVRGVKVSHLRLSINGRLAVAMAFLGVLLIGVGVVGLAGMAVSNAANRHTYSVQMPKSIAVGEMVINVGRQRTSLDRAAINPGSEDAAKMYEKDKEVSAAASKAWKQYLSLPRDAGEDRLASEVTTQYEATERELDIFRQATMRADRDAILKQMVVVGKVYTDMQNAATRLKGYQFQQSERAYEVTEHRDELFRAGSVLAIMAGLLGAFGSWYYLRRAILGPVNEAVIHFEHIAGGDLSRDIEVRTDDEMGRMLRALVAMQDSLTVTAVSLREGSEAIAIATREIAAGNADLSTRTESQAASLQETASSTEELSATVKQNSENALHAKELSSSASQIAQRGYEVVARVVGTMNEISESSSAVADITSIIEGIAFQTNILALNAAVEAARAGEQGRGFSVVAAEVRTLAQRSSVAAKEIKELIANSSARVETGAKLVEEAGRTMAELIAAVSRAHSIMGEIADASREQSNGLDQVSVAVNDMDRAVQQNAALVEQAAAATHSLQQQAQLLSDTAGKFHVRDGKIVAHRL
ncbi:methyl-accepting chemotaxis protein [Burkholderia sp. Bp9004]|uniref:methyl-accepting chemotaxis protein n=1 Tax=Burkholderia sp. Bp9004 TaxID=2184559 RepID=UPI000F5F597B|nr:methyl-accepting chemotaxis protein [Burkholderia sp. Bp9004]RQZ62269.1 HAMP domain-containing protein [Burkholderia sp. Bp9004]